MRGLVATELPRPEADFPEVHLDVPTKALSQLKGVKPGDAVRIVLLGKCSQVSQREPDIEFGDGNVGNLCLEVHKMEITRQDDQFGDLFNEDA